MSRSSTTVVHPHPLDPRPPFPSLGEHLRARAVRRVPVRKTAEELAERLLSLFEDPVSSVLGLLVVSLVGWGLAICL